MKVSLVEWNNERGSALLLTIIVAMVLLFLGGSLGVLSAVESRMAQREEAAMQAYYLARSGADAVAQGIIREPDKLQVILAAGVSEPEGLEDGEGSFTVEVLEAGNAIRIISTGVLRGSESTVELMLLAGSLVPRIEHAVFAGGTGGSAQPAFNLAGATITGTVGTNATHANSVRFAWDTVITDGDLLVGVGADPQEVFQPSRNNHEDHFEGKKGDYRKPAECCYLSTNFFPRIFRIVIACV